MAGEADYLIAVAELIVVPQVQDHGLAVFADLGGGSVEDACATVADAVAADELGVAAEADLLDEVTFEACLAEGLIHFFNGGLALQVEGEDCQGDIWRRNADGVAGQLALQFGNSFGSGLAGTSLCDDHVQGCRTATALFLVVVVQEVLVVGVAVDGLDMTLDDTEVLQHDFQTRNAYDKFGIYQPGPNYNAETGMYEDEDMKRQINNEEKFNEEKIEGNKINGLKDKEKKDKRIVQKFSELIESEDESDDEEEADKSNLSFDINDIEEAYGYAMEVENNKNITSQHA